MTIPIASDVWRKYAIPGVPASGPNHPDKAQIIAWASAFEALLGAGSASLIYSTLSDLNADLAHGASTAAIVYNDSMAANNGLYVKSGASGLGSWTRIGDLPNSIVRFTVTGGTANDIAAVAPEMPTVPGNKLYLLTPTANNTGAATINGVPIKNALGSSLAANSLLNNSTVLMAWVVDHYQILVSVPVDATGVLTDALAARDAASGYATNAAASASALGNQVHQYDTKALAQAATIPGGVGLVHIFGYGAGGDGGAATYKKVGPQPSHAGKLQSADGAWWEIVSDGGRLRPEMFSATADTSAIQTAVDVANAIGAGQVELTNRNYRAVKQGANAWCLHLYGCVSLVGLAAGFKDGVGAGTGTIISWGSAINSSTDIISWTGAAGNARISGIQFMPDGFTDTAGIITGNPLYGRHVINANGVGQLCRVSDNLIGPCNGRSIAFTGSSDFQNGIIEANNIWSGIIAAALLDNVKICQNSFNGDACAADITMVGGASNFIFEHNNGVAAGGAIILRNSLGAKIRDNYFEILQTFSGFNGYLYNINGTVGTIAGCEFKNNICSQLGDYGMTGLVFFDNTSFADIDNNTLLNSGATPIAGIVISANNSKPYCGKTTLLTAGISPTGVTRPGWTVNSPQTVTPRGYDVPVTLQNSWSAAPGFETPSVRMERDGTCHITGAVASGTVTAGTIVFNLPAGFHPVQSVLRTCPANTGNVTAQIASNGNFAWFGSGASATVTGVGCTYMGASD